MNPRPPSPASDDAAARRAAAFEDVARRQRRAIAALTPGERLRLAAELSDAALALRDAGRRARGGGNRER